MENNGISTKTKPNRISLQKSKQAIRVELLLLVGLHEKTPETFPKYPNKNFWGVEFWLKKFY